MESVESPAQISSRKRRRVLPVVDVRFQWKYTLIVTAAGVGLATVMSAFLYRAHMDNTNLLDLSENRLLQEQVVRGDRIFLLYLIALVVVMGLILCFWGLVVTHRISGPLYIVARYLGVLAEGQYPDMRSLRKNDELHDFFAAFEEAVTAMRNRDVQTHRDLEQILAKINEASRKEPDKALQEARGALERYRDVLADSLSRTVD
jgi:hypothetical protein